MYNLYNKYFVLTILKIQKKGLMCIKHKNNYPLLLKKCILKDENLKSLSQIIGKSITTTWSRFAVKSDFLLEKARKLSDYFGVLIEQLFSKKQDEKEDE